ncbi:hypothetical protein BH10BAC2_BH10BAC2_34410 [soil metagenome]
MNPTVDSFMKLLLRRTLVLSVRKSARPKVRKKLISSNSLTDFPTPDFADFFSTVQVSDTTGAAQRTIVCKTNLMLLFSLAELKHRYHMVVHPRLPHLYLDDDLLSHSDFRHPVISFLQKGVCRSMLPHHSGTILLW